MASTSSRTQHRFLASNSSDAAGRALADFVLDVVLVSVLGASAAEMGLLNALGSAAFMLAAVPVGYLVDRHGPLRLLGIGLAGKLLLLITLLILVTTDVLTVALAMLLVTILGISNLISETSQVSAVPTLLDGENQDNGITRLIARLTAADQALGIIIPAAAGILFTLAGAPLLLSVAVTLATWALVLALGLHRRSTRQTQTPSTTPTEHVATGNLLSGFSLLLADRKLVALTIFTSFCNAGLAMGAAVEGILILRHLDLGSGWFGLISAAGAAGGLLGATFGPRISQRMALPKVTLLTGSLQILLAAMVLAAYFSHSTLAVVLLLAQAVLWGVVLVVFNIASMSWVALLVPARYLGRVTSVRRMLTFGVVPLGSLFGGYLGSAFGLWAALLAWCLLCLFGTVGYLITMPQRTSAALPR